MTTVHCTCCLDDGCGCGGTAVQFTSPGSKPVTFPPGTQVTVPADRDIPEYLADPVYARGCEQARHDVAKNLLARIKRIEEPDGSWPGGDVVDLLTSWFTGLGFDIEDDAPSQGGEA